MYGDPTTTPGGKALKFYCSIRVEVARAGGSQEKEKIGGEEVVVGHTIRCKVVKNKVAPPFRKAEFKVYYDGRKTDTADELAEVALLKGLIPRYDAAGNLSSTGRNYKWPSEPNFLAKKKDDVSEELRKFPHVQEEIIKILQGETPAEIHQIEELDSDMSEEDFERMIREEANSIKDGVDVGLGGEETSWDEM